MCRRWQVVILQPTSHIHNPAGRRAPVLVEWGWGGGGGGGGGGTLPFPPGTFQGLKEKPRHPAPGGPWAQWENEDLCAPLNPQEFLIKQGVPGCRGPGEGPHPPPARGLPLSGAENGALHSTLCWLPATRACYSPSPFSPAQELSPNHAFKALRTSSSFHSVCT